MARGFLTGSDGKSYDLDNKDDLKTVQGLLGLNASGAWGSWQEKNLKSIAAKKGYTHSTVKPSDVKKNNEATSTLTYGLEKASTFKFTANTPSFDWQKNLGVLQNEEKPTASTPVTERQKKYAARYAELPGNMILTPENLKHSKRTFLGVDYDISNPESAGQLQAAINKYIGVNHLKQDNMWEQRSEQALNDVESVKKYYDNKRSTLKEGEELTPEYDKFVQTLNGKTYGTTAGNNGGYYQEWNPLTGTYKARNANERGAISINNKLYDLDNNASGALGALGFKQTGTWSDEDQNNQVTMFDRMQANWNKENQSKWQSDFDSNNAVLGEDGIDYSGKWMRDAADKYKSDWKAKRSKDLLEAAKADAWSNHGGYGGNINQQRVLNEELNWDNFGKQFEKDLQTKYGITLARDNSSNGQSFNRTNYTPEQISEILNLPENAKYARAISNILSLQKYIAGKDKLNSYGIEMLSKIMDNTLMGALNNVGKHYQNKGKNQSSFAQGVKAEQYNARKANLKEIGWGEADENIASTVGFITDLIPDLVVGATTMGSGTAAMEGIKMTAQAAARKAAMEAAAKQLTGQAAKHYVAEASSRALVQATKDLAIRSGVKFTEELANQILKEGMKAYGKEVVKGVSKEALKSSGRMLGHGTYFGTRGTAVDAGTLAKQIGDINWDLALETGARDFALGAAASGLGEGFNLIKGTRALTQPMTQYGNMVANGGVRSLQAPGQALLEGGGTRMLGGPTLQLLLPGATETAGQTTGRFANLGSSIWNGTKATGKWAGNQLYNATEYMAYHPVETFVLPEVTNNTIDYGNALSKRYTGYGLSDENANHLKLATMFMVNPALAAKGRSFLAAPMEHEGSGLFTSYLNRAMTNNGRSITQTGNTFTDYLRTYTLPGTIGYGTAEGVNALTDGKGVGSYITDNETGAGIIDYMTNPLIYSATAKVPGFIARPINNANLLAQGAANPITALLNIRQGILHNGWGKFFTNTGIITNKAGNTYTGSPTVTQSLIDKSTYRTVASKVNKNPDRSFLNEIASYKDLKVGLTVGDAGKVTASFSVGHTNGALTAEEALAMRVASADRYGKGSKGFIVKLNGSVDLPKNAVSVVRNEMGGFDLVPSSEAQLMGGRKDILLGNGHYFNQNGHQTAYHKDPVTGEIYETTFDLWGTGSAGGGIVGKFADSGNHPIVSYLTRRVEGKELLNPFVRAATRPKYKPTSKWNMLKALFDKLDTSTLEYSKEEFKPILAGITAEKQRAAQNLADFIRALFMNKQGGKLGLCKHIC